MTWPRQTLGCRCEPKHRWRWAVIVRNGNYSAFNGYRFTPSDYSSVVCLPRRDGCGAVWRTNARYVATLDDVPSDWMEGGR